MQNSLYFFDIHSVAVVMFMLDNNLSTETEEYLIGKNEKVEKGFFEIFKCLLLGLLLNHPVGQQGNISSRLS